MSIIKKICKRILLEIKCIWSDLFWIRNFVPNCFCEKKPSFYIRYTKEEQEKILEKEREEIILFLQELSDKCDELATQ